MEQWVALYRFVFIFCTPASLCVARNCKCVYDTSAFISCDSWIVFFNKQDPYSMCSCNSAPTRHFVSQQGRLAQELLFATSNDIVKRLSDDRASLPRCNASEYRGRFSKSGAACRGNGHPCLHADCTSSNNGQAEVPLPWKQEFVPRWLPSNCVEGQGGKLVVIHRRGRFKTALRCHISSLLEVNSDFTNAICFLNGRRCHKRSPGAFASGLFDGNDTPF